MTAEEIGERIEQVEGMRARSEGDQFIREQVLALWEIAKQLARLPSGVRAGALGGPL